MVEEWSAPVWTVLAVAATALLLVTLFAVVAARTRAQLGALRTRLDDLEQTVRERGTGEHRQDAEVAAQPAPPPAPPDGFVITTVGRTDPDRVPATTPATVPAPLFADVVLRESVVQTASWAAGLRRALSAESRNRIGFEMRREVRRSRRQRRADVRRARRDRDDRQRGAAGETTQGSAA